MVLWDWDVVTDRVAFSENFESLFGIPANSFPPTFTGFLELLHPDDRPRVTGAVKGALSGRNPLRSRFRVCRPDGTLRWFDTKGELLTNENGKVVRMVGATKDITEHVDADARVASQQAALLRLAARRLDEIRDTNAVFWPITEAAARTLRTERASLWLYSDDRSSIRCVDLFELGSGRHSEGQLLTLREYPAYFKALRQGRVLAADDARVDPRTREFGKSYLQPLGITSMLDATIRQAGAVIGVLCCEHVGPRRHWHLDEQNFAGSLADTVAISLELRERQRTEDTLRESERRFRSLVENLPAVAYRCAPDATWTSEFISERIQDLCGYPASDFIDNRVRSFVSVVHPDDEPDSAASVHEAIAQGRPYAVEYRMLHRDGGVRWVQDRGRGVKNEAGQVVCLDGVITDVTEPKLAEQRIAAQSRLLLELATHETLARGDLSQFLHLITKRAAQVLGTERAAVWLYNPSGTKSRCVDLYELSRGRHSHGAEVTIAEHREYFEALHANRIIAADDTFADVRMSSFMHEYLGPHQVLSSMDAAIRRGNEMLGAVCFEHVGNRHRWQVDERQFGASIADFIALAMERAEMKQAEQAIRQSEARYRALHDSAGDAIVIARPGDRVIVECNPKALEIFGCGRDQFIGRSAEQFFGIEQPGLTDWRGGINKRIKSALAGEPQEFVWRNRRRDGELFDAEVTLTEVGLEGQPHLLALIRDVTERQQAEQEIKRSRAELQERNRSLTIINELADRLHRSVDVQGLAAEAVETLVRHTEAPMVALYELDEPERCLRLLAHHGFTQETVSRGESLPLDASLSGLVIESGEVMASPEIAKDPRLAPNVKEALIDQGVVGAVSIPLLFHERTLGVMNLVYDHPVTLPDQMRETLTGLGRTIGLAMTNVRHLQQLRTQATHDSLTGLPNRLLLREQTDRAIARAQSGGHRSALLLIDLDGFKEINDTLGHHIGDSLLKLLAHRLRAAVGERGSTLARLGGDEFAIVLPRIDGEDQAAAYAHQIRSSLRRPFSLDGVTLEVGASIGIAICPEHGTDSSSLLRCADVAMYQAKRDASGYSIYAARLDPHTPQRLALMTELGAAIREDQLVLHYQPKVDVRAQRIVGFEALVRWNHPERGLIPPNEFIELAEMSELIRPLTSWVVDRALRQWREWRDQGKHFTIAVNLSARNLLDQDFPDEIAAALETYRVDIGHLELEITESALISDPERALMTLDRLNELGVRFAIDDFGTGYSSLSYLQRLPIHILKIDRSFVSQVASQEHDRIIVQSTINLAKNLALKVVAEGVEDHTTLSYLDALGCDVVQGFFVSRPLESEAIEAWLAKCAWSST